MIRGTTPTHVFGGLPVMSEDVQQIWVSYQQAGRVILVKDVDSVVFDDNFITNSTTASVTLSQEETLSFKSGVASVQVRILLMDGTALASKEIEFAVERVIKDGQIS